MMATPKPRPVTSWHDLSDTINNNLYGKPLHKTSAYSGLRHIVEQSSLEKKAVVVTAGVAAAFAWKAMMAYWLAQAGVNVAKHGGKAVGAAVRGQGGKALGHVGQAGLSALWALPGLGQAGRGLKGVAGGVKMLRGVKKVTPLWRRAGQKGIDLSRSGVPNPLAKGVANPISRWYGPERFGKGIGPERLGGSNLITGNIPQKRVESWGRFAQRGYNRFAGTAAGQRVAANPALQRTLQTRGKALIGAEKRMMPGLYAGMGAEMALPPGGIPEWQEQRHQYRLDKPALRQRARRAMRPRRPQITAPNIW